METGTNRNINPTEHANLKPKPMTEQEIQWRKDNPGMEPPPGFFEEQKITTAVATKEKTLPSLADLHYDTGEAFKHDVLNQFLNNEPIKKWVKSHPYINIDNTNGQPGKIPLPYIPIDKVEFLLTRIFQEWRVEVKSVAQLFNSVAVVVRLHYKSPISGEWLYHDGTGAVGVQTDKGASAADLTAIKSDAVMKALPAAKSYAIKDAAEHLGRIFGRDLTRKDSIGFTASYTAPESLKANAMGIPEQQTT